MILFNRKPAFCTVCNKQLTHRHKAKREWDVKSPLCGDCYVDKMQEVYDASVRQKCVSCETKKKISDLWEPRWQWDMKGLLCKNCFDKKESDFDKKKEFCVLCGAKMGFFRYNPKGKWKVDGQLCRSCWDSQKLKHG